MRTVRRGLVMALAALLVLGLYALIVVMGAAGGPGVVHTVVK